MAAKPGTREDIANTEKKLDMPLDDIIKMSRKATTKEKKWRPRASNKTFFNNAAQWKALKVQQYMVSRPIVRQGYLAQRRTKLQGNQFPLAAEAPRKAVVTPFRNRPIDRTVVSNSHNPRIRSFKVQRRAANGGFAAKASLSEQQIQGEGGVKQRPKTLDSLFASMKLQRMRALNNVIQRNGNGGRPRAPWTRGRYAN